MYNDFLTKTFARYRVLNDRIKNINDIKEYYAWCNIFDYFIDFFEFNRKILRNRAWFSIKAYKEYKSYKEITQMMYDGMFNTLTAWKKQYNDNYEEALKDAKDEAKVERQVQKARDERVKVKGFAAYMTPQKKTKRKYTKKKNGNKNKVDNRIDNDIASDNRDI